MYYIYTFIYQCMYIIKKKLNLKIKTILIIYNNINHVKFCKNFLFYFWINRNSKF